MIESITGSIRRWIIQLFASAIANTSHAEDRVAALRWLGQSRDVVASELSAVEKFRQLNALLNSRAVAMSVALSVAESVRNYRQSSLPWSIKIALPATLAAIPLVGGQGAGIAAFGGAIGVPVLLLIFLGAAGITSIIESVIANPESRTDIAAIIDVLLEDERLRRASAQMKAAMRDQPMEAARQPMPADDAALRAHLAGMNPFAFEQHVMSFFVASCLKAWATRKSNDLGVDGFAACHGGGFMVVQCKRHASDNKVGRPVVQQFKGVIEEQKALCGYIVTTSTFTDEAKASARLSDKVA